MTMTSEEAWAKLDRLLGFAWDRSTRGGSNAIDAAHTVVEDIVREALADTLGLLEALAKKYGYAIVGERVPEDEDFLAHNTNIVEVFTFTPEGGEGLYYCDGNGEEQPRAEAAALLRDEPPTAGRSEGD